MQRLVYALAAIVLGHEPLSGCDVMYETDATRILYDAMYAARQRLRSGQCTVLCTNSNGERWQGRNAFDRDRQLDRWEFTLTLPSGESISRCMISTPEMQVEHERDQIQLHDPAEFPSGWDWSAVGIVQWDMIKESYRLEQFLAELKESEVATRIASSAVDESLTAMTLIWETSPSDRYRRSYVLDEASDLAPVRHELAYSSGSGDDGDWSAWRTLVAEDISWTVVDGVSVPTGVTSRRFRTNVKTGEQVESGSSIVEIEWNSVNADIDTAMFHYRSLDVPKQTMRINDFRRGREVTIQRGRSGSAASRGATGGGSRASGSRRLLLTVNAAVFLLACIAFVWRRMRSSRG